MHSGENQRFDRVIGRYGGDHSGPLLLVIAGIHGNEKAGVLALQKIFHLLRAGKQNNPEFVFQGTIVGVAGNLQALIKGVRYIERDMNRFLLRPYIDQLRYMPSEYLNNEDLEILELVQTVDTIIQEFQPEEMFVLDLHTTTAHDGVFCLVTNDKKSIEMGANLKVPIIKGFMDGLPGTTMDYFTESNTGLPTTGVVFESGQHEESESIDNAVAATINCMRSIGCVDPSDVENKHDERLEAFSSILHHKFRLIYVHSITDDDCFLMRKGYNNYSPVKKGDWLGTDRYGAVLANCDGLLLMPLYQKQGSDGFFIIEPVVKTD